jgi:hypothetical protein
MLNVSRNSDSIPLLFLCCDQQLRFFLLDMGMVFLKLNALYCHAGVKWLLLDQSMSRRATEVGLLLSFLGENSYTFEQLLKCTGLELGSDP